MKNKSIVIAASGTGGHIYPGIALAEEFKNRGYNPIFFISNNSASVEILKNSGFEYITFNIFGMPRKISFSFIIFLIRMKFAFLKALKQIVRLKSLAVVGTGGYVTVPVIFAATILHKKTFIHEQNSIPGKANILLDKIVDKTFVSFLSSKKYFKNAGISGYPIRKDILSTSKEKSLQKFKLKNELSTVLIFGGSLGAVKLNEITCETLLELSIKNKLQVLHITGFKNYVEIQEKVKDSSNYRIFKYMHNICDAYAASDIVICRSGAGSIFELKVLDKPVVLVPYPYATDNHQYWNAKEIEKNGRVIIIEEKDLTKENLRNAVYTLKKNIKSDMVKNIIKLPQELIFEEIVKCLKS
ncbi:MAG: undecaprenyldiphospho-muramoylpentapeptide beta-N-acetylglucosaminyltransferase [Endomicrobium sp.]|jgi:UDP-N-acetylglucosamine--N-acetylmuramyl-(pentapeptide) pyrophosphoryl-undecaprenol N-acetylglucosamine transferase|nr:undecaprenyldiphospho-muramoylpentapeptide beta-N-acetylglucosaminyltransferase [Endomicrobium sp.]